MNDVIRTQLPYLRRFARALLGRQAAADALVARALEGAGADPAGSETDRPSVRRSLLRALVDAHGREAAAVADEPTVSDEAIVASRIRALPKDPAIALLLASLEEQDADGIGFVMRCPAARAEALLAEAQRILDAQAATDILVIEDEPVIAMDIASIIRQSGHRVVGIAATRDEAVAMAEARPPGLILADIKLADDSSGIAAVDDILELLVAARPGGATIPVVFITAYPERLLDDERLEPSLLITKPFGEHLLRVAIAQALQMAGPPREPAA